MNFLGRILGDNPGLAEFGNFYDQTFNAMAERNEQRLQDRTLANLNRAGIAAMPTGQDILGRSLAENTAATNAAYAGQVAQMSVPLVQLAKQIAEYQKQRDFSAAQAQLDRAMQIAEYQRAREFSSRESEIAFGRQSTFTAEQAALAWQRQIEEYERAREYEARQAELNRAQQLEYLQRQMVTYPIDYNRGMIPVNSEAFTAATNTYRSLYPNWNQDPSAGMFNALQQRGGGGGGGFGQDAGKSFRDDAANFFGWDAPKPDWTAWREGQVPMTAGNSVPGWVNDTPYTGNATTTGDYSTDLGFDYSTPYTDAALGY